MNGADRLCDTLLINGEPASEFTISAYTAGMMGVPLVFLSGDAALCGLAREMVPGITTVATSEGSGNSATGMHPDDACNAIRVAMRKAMKEDYAQCKVEMPPYFEAEVRYKWHYTAYRNSFYPGARQVDTRTVAFEAED